MNFNIRNIPSENNSRYKQGDFDRFQPKKYVGKYPIRYRSSYEFRMMIKLELNPKVLKWASEDIVIPYTMQEKIDGRLVTVKHNYVTDFTVELVTGEKYILEVKPGAHVPLNESQLRRNPIMYKNGCKWRAAISYCKQKGYIFKIITEKELQTKIF